MIKALETAGLGYLSEASRLNLIANRIRQAHGESDMARDFVDMMGTSRRAQACLEVAKVVDSLGESLLHIVA